MVSEAAIERKCAALAKRAGCWMPKWSSPSHAGVPDRILIMPGRIIFIEFKAPGKHPTRLQHHYLSMLQNMGHTAAVIDSVDDFKKILETTS